MRRQKLCGLLLYGLFPVTCVPLAAAHASVLRFKRLPCRGSRANKNEPRANVLFKEHTMVQAQSVEPNIADLANGWLRSYNLEYKLEQESLNTEIDQALNDYFSKNGGGGVTARTQNCFCKTKILLTTPF